MLRPTKSVEAFIKWGFKPCKGLYGKNGCYYLCVDKDRSMIFVSDVQIEELCHLMKG